MKVKTIRYITIGLLSLLAVSCFDHKGGNRYVISYVDEIVNDTTSSEYRTIASFNVLDAHGSIAVVGDPESAKSLSELLIGFDRHDNVSGSHIPDGLPDFSGEIISEILDIANSPYANYIANGKEDFLKEINVRNFLFAIDTLYSQTPHDLSASLYKQKSKLVIFSSSYSSAFGSFDVDTLCASLGKDIPVIDPVKAMVKYAYERHKAPLNLAVWSDRSKIGNGVYSAISDSFSSRHDNVSEYEAFSPIPDTLKTDKDLLVDFLDMYLASGNTKKISAILLDQSGVSVDSLNAEIKEILSTEEDNLLIYKNILVEDAGCICPGEAIAEQCYAYLRSQNAFTHRIAYPEVKSYVTAPVPESEGQSYTIVEMSEKYAPKPDSLYVR